MSSLRYLDDIPQNQPFKAAIEILMSFDFFYSQLSSLPTCHCYTSCLVYESVTLFKRLSTSKQLSISPLRFTVEAQIKHFKQYSSHTSLDPIEIISVILMNFHSLLTTGRCYENESSLLTVCNYECILHKFFYLGVKETHSCICGSTSNNQWEYNNICQYFNISRIFEQMDIDNSKNLVLVPKPLIEKSGFGNVERFSGCINQKIKEKLINAKSGVCLKEYCKFKEASIRFEVTNAPKVFIINLVWESETRHLHSFLASAGIRNGFRLKDVYLNGVDKLYSISGVLFSRKEKFKYAQLKDGYWKLEGLHSQATWYELLCETTLLNFRPVGLVYVETNMPPQDFAIPLGKLLKIELMAIQSTIYMSKTQPFFTDQDDITGLYLKPKRVGVSRAENINERSANTQDPHFQNFRNSSYEPFRHTQSELDRTKREIFAKAPTEPVPSSFNHFERNSVPFKVPTRDSSPARNRVSFAPSQSLTESRPNFASKHQYQSSKELSLNPFEQSGVDRMGKTEGFPKKNPENPSTDSYWLCVCDKVNFAAIEKCSNCGYSKPVKQGWTCKNCKKQNPEEKFNICSFCNEFNLDWDKHVQNPRPGTSISLSNWKCKCGSENDVESKSCQTCTQLRPGVKGWLCGICKGLNEEISIRCIVCKNFKGSNRVGKDYWICQKCKTAISSGIDQCENCLGKGVSKMKCPYCFKQNLASSVYCVWCKEQLQEGLKKNIEGWVCHLCQSQNGYDSEFCRHCNQEKVKDGWTCKICNTYNKSASVICSNCMKFRPENERVPISSSEAVTQKWKCGFCQIENYHTTNRCAKCSKLKKETELKYQEDKAKLVERSVELGWKCDNCGIQNGKIATACSHCRKPKPKKAETLVFRRCSMCSNELAIVVCVCGKASRVELGKCSSCHRDLSCVTVCNGCHEKLKRQKGVSRK